MDNLIKSFEEASFTKKLLLILGLFFVSIMVFSIVKIALAVLSGLTLILFFLGLPLIFIGAVGYFIKTYLIFIPVSYLIYILFQIISQKKKQAISPAFS